MHFRRLCNWFKAGWDTPSSDDLTDGMARALRPLVAWVPSANDLNGVGFQARSDLAWNLYMSAMSRTVVADAFPLVTSSEDSWNESCYNPWRCQVSRHGQRKHLAQCWLVVARE